MSALWAEGLVGHEWKADRCPCYHSMLGMVNTTCHLWRVDFGPDEGSTRVISLWFAVPSIQFHHPDPRLGVVGLIRGWVLPR